MVNRLKATFPSFLMSILNSYSQVFFSNSKFLGLLLMAVSFFDPWAGVSGVTAVVVSNTLAYLIGFNRVNIRFGYYGYNSLLAGLGLGVFYQPGAEFLIVLAFTSLLTLFLTLWFEGFTGRHGLPFLSLSFLVSIWLVSLASRQFTSLHLSEHGIFMINEMYRLGGSQMVSSYHWLNNLLLPDPVRLYFTSLGAIFFQYHLLAGILIAIGLFAFSRISFLLSLTGFFAAWFYYQFIGANIQELSYSYIGFNFILTSMAVGGFFIIPSRWSFLWVILLTPLISITLTASQAIFSLFQLSVYSLPFNLVVLLFLYALKFRERFSVKPEMVVYQQFSPEKNLYSQLNYRARFGKSVYLPLILPFWGEWTITQSHNGKHTHKGDWRHAYDFELADEQGRRFIGEGTTPSDYLCYNKPVVAPADGTVEAMVDGVEDNDIGKVDLENNWGNTLVIRHSDHLFSKLSHLKNGSLKVKPGDPVKRGTVVASCGNSGRSPIPHLHFQLQTTPYIGSKTIEYPISHYIHHTQEAYTLRSYEIPAEGDLVTNITMNTSLEKAFRFIPGQKFTLRADQGTPQEELLEWEVELSPVNTTCIRCTKTNGRAWFRNDGEIHYFTHFEGDRNTLLFRFYLGAYKVLMGYYGGLTVNDNFPVNTFTNPILGIMQDLVSPFFLFLRTDFTLRYLTMEDALLQTGIRLASRAEARFGGYVTRSLECEFNIGAHGIEQVTITENDKISVIQWATT